MAIMRNFIIIGLLICMLMGGISLLNAKVAPASISAQASIKSVDDVDAIIKSSPDSQSEMFLELVKSKLTYSTARSLYGTSGKWIASVNIDGKYVNGQVESYSIGISTIQYAMRMLPSSTKSCTFKIGDYSKTLSNNKQMVFSFNNEPLTESNINVLTDKAIITIDDQGSLIEIDLATSYPNKDIPSMNAAIEKMAPAYLAFIKANGPDPIVSTYMQLKSFLNDSSKNEYSYIWELCIVHDQSDSKLTTIRYNCDTQKTSVTSRL